MNERNNKALIEFGCVFELDGDWLRCRVCRKPLIASRDGEALHHKEGCRHASYLHPWQMLRDAIAEDHRAKSQSEHQEG